MEKIKRYSFGKKWKTFHAFLPRKWLSTPFNVDYDFYFKILESSEVKKKTVDDRQIQNFSNII